MILFPLALERERGADQVGQGLDQLGFPGLRRVSIDKMRLELTQFAALVADAEGLRAGFMVFLARGAIAAGANFADVGAMQGEQLLGRGLQLTLQAQRQAQAGQALLEAPDQLIQTFGIGQACGQASTALVQQFKGSIGLLQVQGFLLHLTLKGAMRVFDRLGHGVETHGQLAQFVLGLMVDPHLEIATTKTLGRVHQLFQGRDHAILQFVKPKQQDDHRGEQRQALDNLLPALLLFALALQQVDEMVQLLNEGQGLDLKIGGITALQCRFRNILRKEICRRRS